MSWRDDLIVQAQLYADRTPVAQGTERRSSKPTVAGSSPVGGTNCPDTPHRQHADPTAPCPLDCQPWAATAVDLVRSALQGMHSAEDRMATREAGRCKHEFPLGLHCHEKF